MVSRSVRDYRGDVKESKAEYNSAVLWKYYLLINFVTLAIWGWDKYAAIARLRRIPEKTLLLLIGLGGLGGSLLGMAVFRHKIRHGIFYVVPLVALIPHLLLASWIMR